MFLGLSDIEISPIILGTWQAGKEMWVGISDSDSIDAIESSISVGVTTIDTAAIYGNGHSELIVGKAIKKFPRSSVQILSKVFPTELTYERVLQSCDDSLVRLQTDYIDLLQVHWPSGEFGSSVIPIAETMSAFVELQKQGKIRAIGVSNFATEQIVEAQKFATIVSNQPPYSLFWRQSESYAINYCQAHGITTLAYSTLAQGILSGRFRSPESFPKEDYRSRNKLLNPQSFSQILAALDQLEAIALGKQISLSALALAWVTNQPNCAAIVGARNKEQAIANASVISLSLTHDEMLAVTAISNNVATLFDADPKPWI